jgi:hypothetical protein
MFSPNADKNVIHKRIRDDPTIRSLMGITTDADVASKIIKHSQWDDLVTNDKRMCIYFRPSRNGSEDAFKDNIIQIDIHVPSSLDYVAEKIQERLVPLLHYMNPNSRVGRFAVNNKIIQFDGQLGELPTLAGFVCIGSRFCYQSTI